MRTVHLTLTGLLAAGLLLAAVAATVGLSVLGWAVGLVVAGMTGLLVTRGLVRSGARAVGPANAITLTRATLVAAVTALVAESLVLSGSAPTGAIVALTVPALALDAVDGAVARRTGTVTAVGARFDMEVDAFLIMVLGAFVAVFFGPWVLLIGLARYTFVGAAMVLPWLRAPLPPRYWRKVVAAVTGIVLTFAVAGVGPSPVTAVLLLAALALLTESFGRDVLWLWARRAGAVAGVSRPVLDRPAGATTAIPAAVSADPRPAGVAAVVLSSTGPGPRPVDLIRFERAAAAGLTDPVTAGPGRR